MAEQSGFFPSVNGDRKYFTSFFAEYFADFISNGIYPNPSTQCQVLANNDMTVTLKTGNAYINGYRYKNDSDKSLSIETADGILKRIDRIVLRYSTLDRNIKTYVKKGAFASTPVAPNLQRDADAWELGIADIYVVNGAVSISQANITDLRLNSAYCGIVHGVVDQVDTTTLFNQYQAWIAETTGQGEADLETMLSVFQSDFNTWFLTLQDALSGDVAGNLLIKINENTDNLSTHTVDDILTKHKAKQIEIEDTANNFTATNMEGAVSELFTNVSNGKDSISGAITDIDENVVIPTNPSFGDLATGIGQISTGKKWASGVITPSYASDIQYHIKIQGLVFRPTIFMFWTVGDELGPYNEFYLYNGGFIVDKYYKKGNQSFSTFETRYNDKEGIYDDGFLMRTSNNKQVFWIAFE